MSCWHALLKMIGVGLAPAAAVQISGDLLSGLVATGSTQGTALLVQSDNSFFVTVAAATGAILPSNRSAADDLLIYNGGANPLTVYPPVGASINLLATNASLAVPSGKVVHAICRDGFNWTTILSA